MIQRMPPVFRGRIGLSLVCGTLLCLVFGSVPARAEDAPGNRATLKGIPAVRVIVAPMRMDAERDGLRSDELLPEVERKLKAAGIQVLPSASEVLYVEVETKRAGDSPRYACSIGVDLMQIVRLDRDPKSTLFAPTWGLRRVEELPAHQLPSVRRTVTEMVDGFISAYRQQNPLR